MPSWKGVLLLCVCVCMCVCVCLWLCARVCQVVHVCVLSQAAHLIETQCGLDPLSRGQYMGLVYSVRIQAAHLIKEKAAWIRKLESCS